MYMQICVCVPMQMREYFAKNESKKILKENKNKI